jgi:F-type H+-transporting ATPase subunit a
MRRAALILPLIWAAAAWARHPHGEGARTEKEEKDVAGFILHHVSNSDELEIEVPLNPDKNVVIELPEIRIPMTAGACETADEDTGFGPLKKGCLDLSITKHTVMMWLALGLLLLFAILGSHRDKTKLVPHGTRKNLIEMIVLFIRDEIAVKNIGKADAARYTPYLLTIFFFILFMNLLGLIPEMATATGNLAITAGLAVCTFIVTQAAGIRSAGLKGYLKHLTGGVHWVLWPIMVPVEILGLFTKPFALTVRLFANMLAGHIVIFFLLGLIFILGNVLVAGVSVPFAMAIYFLELFVALVQAYIFTMLSSLFIGMGVAIGHHEHGHAEHKEGAHGEGHGAAPQHG